MRWTRQRRAREEIAGETRARRTALTRTAKRVVLPLPNEINAIRHLTAIMRALKHLGFFPVCLTA
jgi:hypothetical protein